MKTIMCNHEKKNKNIKKYKEENDIEWCLK